MLLAIPSAGTTPPEGAGAADTAGVGAAGELGAVSVLAALVTADAEVTLEPLVVLTPSSVGEPLTRSVGDPSEAARCLPERWEPLRRPLDTDPATEAWPEESAPAAPDASREPFVLGEFWAYEGPPPEDRPSRKGPLPARDRPLREGRPGGNGWPPADPLTGESWGLGEDAPCGGGAPLSGCGAGPPLGGSLPCAGLPAGEVLRADGDPAGEALPGW